MHVFRRSLGDTSLTDVPTDALANLESLGTL